MRRRLRRPAVLAMVALISVLGAGCGSNTPSETRSAGSSGIASNSGTGGNQKATDRDKAVKFAECMRSNGVSEFPDPSASGKLTIDAVANGSSLDPSTPAFKQAVGACKHLEPAGFMGSKRSPQQMDAALKFAQCMRAEGVHDFPDPTPNGPLVDTNRIPSAAEGGE